MSRRDIGTDDDRVRVRPGRGSRPRTKVRPNYDDAERGMVTAVVRGRYRVMMDSGTELLAMKARELGRGSVVVGDRAGVVGDLSGTAGTLARIVAVDERRHVLTRSAEDGDTAGVERAVVANAGHLAIVTALADPPPRTGLVDRYLVAAYDAGMRPSLILTKADLADPQEFLAQYAALDMDVVITHAPDDDDVWLGLDELRGLLDGNVTVFVGHSGVGKSTLVNALVPGADRATGDVNDVTGRGRHTSSSAVALALPAPLAGWVIDTPGVRSFGLAHVSPDSLLRGFDDLAEAAEDCPRGCTHGDDAPDCALDEWAAADREEIRTARLASYRRLLGAR